MSANAVEVDVVLTAIDDLLVLLDQAEDNPACAAGLAFFDSVRNGAEGIKGTVTDKGFATKKQLKAVENWTSGVSKWTASR